MSFFIYFSVYSILLFLQIAYSLLALVITSSKKFNIKMKLIPASNLFLLLFPLIFLWIYCYY